MRGEGTYLSDIDLVVVFDHIDTARRECFMTKGVPIERRDAPSWWGVTFDNRRNAIEFGTARAILLRDIYL